MLRPVLLPYLILAVLLLTAACLSFRGRRLVTIFAMIFILLLGIIVTAAVISRHSIQSRLAESLDPSVRCSFSALLAEDPIVVGPVHSRDQRPLHNIRARALIESIEVDGKDQPFHAWAVLRITVDECSDFRYGDRVRCVAALTRPPPARNPGYFDYAAWLRQQGIYTTGVVDQPEDISLVKRGNGNPLRRALWFLRRRLRRSLLAGNMRDSSRGFLLGMTIGERELVDSPLREALVSTNSMHILAISGLHVGVFALAMLSILRLVPVRRNTRLLLVIALLFMYAALLDFRPPALRAAIMISALMVSPLLKRESDPVNTLAFSAISILLVRPLDLFAASFQLSMLIVFTLIMLASPISALIIHRLHLAPDTGFIVIGQTRRKLYSLLRYLIRLLAASVAAFIGSAPLVAYYFHLINPLSVLSNAIIVLFVSMAVPLGLLSAIVGLVCHSVAAVFNYINGILINSLIGIVRLFSGVSFSIMYLRSPALLHVFGCYLLVGLVGFSAAFSTRARAVLVLVLLAALVLIPFNTFFSGTRDTRVTIFDLDLDEVHLIQTSKGDNILVNTGSDSERTVSRVVHPFLRAVGINRISTIVLTQLDEDYCGGIEYVLDRHSVDRVVVPDSHNSRYAEEVVGMLNRRGVEVVRVPPYTGCRIASDSEVSVRVAGPVNVADDNRAAILTLAVRKAAGTVLFLIGVRLEDSADLIEEMAGPGDLVLVSDLPTILFTMSAAHYNPVIPRVLVLTGRKFPWTGPVTGALGAETSDQPKVISTNRSGAVTIDLSENGFEIHTMLPYNP
jgi:competence protein ComEC